MKLATACRSRLALGLMAASPAFGVAGQPAHAQAVQWSVEAGGNGHWYGLATLQRPDMTWMEMRDAAKSMGGHLITLSSAAEDAFAYSAWRNLGFRFAMMAGPLGYSVMPGGQWESVTGEPIAYSNWRPATTIPPLLAAPDNGNALHRFATWLDPDWGPLAGRWEDWLDSELGNPADPVSRFMVEWDADCDGDGIVDFGQIRDGTRLDVNANGIPDSCDCLADLFRDATVNGADLGILLAQWGLGGPSVISDLDRSGTVDGADLGVLLSSWGPCPS